MSQQQLSDDAPATALFPQYESELYQMIAGEVEGLTDQQLDFESDRWEWSKWSIRRNLSHMASGDFRWLVARWGEELFPEGPPEIKDLDNIVNSPYDRRLDETRYWVVDDILKKLREGLDLSKSILSRETVASIQDKEIPNPRAGLWASYSSAHPRGVRPDPDNPDQVLISLEATFRHRYYEYITHLYNIQRLKRAQGLPARAQIPLEGYWALPGWDRSEP
ncbi:MAG TPA: hypothetical protein VFA32_14605 [Dehalococcoidia bacterium]|nr:hypothetical protein [Dehalococcoidia bacterium]